MSFQATLKRCMMQIFTWRIIHDSGCSAIMWLGKHPGKAHHGRKDGARIERTLRTWWW
jgi:hypothetical protein